MKYPLRALALLGVASRIDAQAVPVADTAFARAQYKDAFRHYAVALKSTPGNRVAAVKAGYAALAIGRPDTAEVLFRSALAGAPPGGAPNVKAGLAIVTLRKGNRDEALAGFETAVRDGYGNVDLLDETAKEHKLTSDPRFSAVRERALINAFPCMGDSASRSFDFWVGDWDVYVTGTGIRAGRNVIERVSGGCTILENWTASHTPVGTPSNGKSMNFVDPATGKWRQVWMGSGRGQTNYVDGAFSDGAMRFVYERAGPQGARVTGRFVFENLGPDRVRQYQDQTLDGGKTYTIVYDFTYFRRKAESGTK